MQRFILTFTVSAVVIAQAIAGAERCAERLERQQLQRATQLVSIEQAAR